MSRSMLCGVGGLALCIGLTGALWANQRGDENPRQDAQDTQEVQRESQEAQRESREAQRDARESQRRSARDARGTVRGEEDARISEELPAHLARVSDVDGINVYAKDGEELGQIQELVIDLNGGCVRYAVLAFGGFLGIGDKYFAVPWQSLALTRTEDRDQHFVINISADRLRNAPGFNKDQWPDFADEKLMKEIDKFYGVDRRQMGFRPGERERRRERDRGLRGDQRNRAGDRTEENRGTNAPSTQDDEPEGTPPSQNEPEDKTSGEGSGSGTTPRSGGNNSESGAGNGSANP